VVSNPGFREELREIYPGVWLGKMYALPGSAPYGGAVQVESS
jgi:hypothetical protein